MAGDGGRVPDVSEQRALRCPECGRVASVPEWCSRPICVHAWDGCSPEIWDGDNDDGEGRAIEQAPNEAYRLPGPNTWSEMVPLLDDPASVLAALLAEQPDATVAALHDLGWARVAEACRSLRPKAPKEDRDA